jgi:hypothetical protein
MSRLSSRHELYDQPRAVAIATPSRRWRHALRATGWTLLALTLTSLTLFNLT